MKAMRSTRRHWTDWYPVESELLYGASSAAQDILLVDVGGGKGHDLQRFSQRFHAAKGRLVLQDLAQTVDEVEEFAPSIELVSHDFFCAQPMHGQSSPMYRSVSVAHGVVDLSKALGHTTPILSSTTGLTIAHGSSSRI